MMKTMPFFNSEGRGFIKMFKMSVSDSVLKGHGWEYRDTCSLCWDPCLPSLPSADRMLSHEHKITTSCTDKCKPVYCGVN